MYWLKDWCDCPRIPVIYMLYCIDNDKFYIGSCDNMRRRIGDHFRQLNRNDHRNSHLQNVSNKYGINRLQVHILEEIQSSLKNQELFNLCRDTEQLWLDIYYGQVKCLNQTPNAYYGITRTKSVIQYCKNSGNKLNIWESISNAAKVLKISKGHITECCKKQRKTVNDYVWRYESDNIEHIDVSELKVNRIHARKPVGQYDVETGTLIAQFDYAKAAEISTGVKTGQIRMCCLNKQKTAKGYKWKYIEEGKPR